jgi:hypothetical protein
MEGGRPIPGDAGAQAVTRRECSSTNWSTNGQSPAPDVSLDTRGRPTPGQGTDGHEFAGARGRSAVDRVYGAGSELAGA